MRINRKKSSPISQQSPPQEIPQEYKNQKNSKGLASKTISQNSVSSDLKRATEGIILKIEKKSIEKLISDVETEEGCDFLINSFIDSFYNNSDNDTNMLRSLIIVYILLNMSNSIFRSKIQYILPEILTITTLNFKKPKAKLRDLVHNLAKAIYLNLNYNIPLPSLSQIGPDDVFSQFIPINTDFNSYGTKMSRNKSSLDIEIENDNFINDNNYNSEAVNIIDNLVDSTQQKHSESVNVMATNNNINNPDDDLIDCNDMDEELNENRNKLADDLISDNNTNQNSSNEINNIPVYLSKAKQAFDDYVKNSSQEDGNIIINQQNSAVKNSFDNLLLLPDDSFNTSSSIIYASGNFENNDNQTKNNYNTKNILNNNYSSEQKYSPEVDLMSSPTRRRPKVFNISKGKNDFLSSPSIPRSHSLQVNMPIILDQSTNSNLNSDAQQLQISQNSNNYLNSNQIIDLTKPASTPTSPTNSLIGTTQINSIDSILSSQPNASPQMNYNSPTSNYNSPSEFISPPKFNSPTNFNSMESTSNYNSESVSSLLLNSNQYSSQLSKSNSLLNSNISLISESTLNSVSDSILKIPSRSSDIHIVNSPSKLKSDIQLNSSNLILSSNTISDLSMKSDALNTNNIFLNPDQESKNHNSSRFNVKRENLSSSVQNQNEVNSQNNSNQPKAKKIFKIEKKSGKLQNDNRSSINLSQIETSTDSTFAHTQNDESLFDKYENDNNSFPNKANNNIIFNDQDLFNTSIKTSNNEDNFEAGKPKFGLDDIDDQFEPIMPLQSSNTQILDDAESKEINPATPSKLISSSDTQSSQEERFEPITPTRQNLIDDSFVPITPTNSIKLNSSDTNKVDDENVNSNNSAMDDLFVPITPVKNSLDLLNDDLFIKSKSDGASFNSDQFVPITPVKSNPLFSDDDQFVPITPVKNTIDRIFDDDSSSNTINSNNDNLIIDTGKASSNDIQSNSKNGTFIPLSPSDKDIIAFSDDSIQQNSNKKFGELVPLEKVDINNENSNGNGEFSDQFVPISPVSERIIPTFSQSNDMNENSFHGIMRGGNSNNIDNILAGSSPRGRRHLSFDSRILSPSSSRCDKFEIISGSPNKSMIYNSQFYNKSEATQGPKTNYDDPLNNKSPESFTDQFVPITPPSSQINRSQVDELIQSNIDNLSLNDPMFNQIGKDSSKFDEFFDKRLNTNAQKSGSHHLFSLDVTKNNGLKQNDLGNFELINSDNNVNTNANINFETYDTNSYSKSQDLFRKDSNLPPSNNNINKKTNSNRFKVSRESTSSSQMFNGNGSTT